MRIALKNISLKCFLVLMAFQVLNQSFDSIEFHPLSLSNYKTTFNHLNTVTEYVTEVVFGKHNAYPETQKKPRHKLSSLKHITISAFEPQAFGTGNRKFTTLPPYPFSIRDNYAFLFSKNITPPPPKA